MRWGSNVCGWGVVEGGWRKGPWTAEEDRLLVEYVRLHDEGRWNSVARLTGLKRNGKSCRLRWVNYLRPDLKRGHITPREESIILDLHAKWGNRWSAIARSLPGRTDNEIKNYWRTRFKKKTKSLADKVDKTKTRLLKRQQFQLQRQKETGPHHLQQQPEQQLVQFDRLDMTKILSLLEEEDDNSSGGNIDSTVYVPQTGQPFAADGHEEYLRDHNWYWGAVAPMVVHDAAAMNEDIVFSDGLWNFDVEGQGNFGVATATTAACCASRKACFHVTPFC